MRLKAGASVQIPNLMRDLPGFFYDEEKGKYFPIHMKKTYDKEKRSKEQEQEKKLKEESERTKDLYKFIGNSPVRFDSVSERISRMQVTEIIWPQMVQIDSERGVYFRYKYNWQNECHIIQQVKISTGEELKRFKLRYRRVLLKFHVIYPEDLNEFFLFAIFLNDLHDKNYLILSTPENAIYSFYVDQEFSNFKVFNHHDRLIFSCYRTLNCRNRDFATIKDESITFWNERLPSTFDFFAAFPQVGLIEVFQGGWIKIRDNKNGSSESSFKLFNSSAKWIHYYENKLLILTHHGDLVTIELENGNQEEIFNVNDLEFVNERFEDLIIDAKGKVIVIGYTMQKDLFFFNWIEKKIIKKKSFSKPIKKFELSSNLLNLYIHKIE